MMTDFEQQYFDILHAIEQTIHNTHVQIPTLVDFQVNKVLEGLERTYTAEKRLRPAPNLRLNPEEKGLYDALWKVCGLYLGRDTEVPLGTAQTITLDEMIACVKRIQRSVHLMRDKGRQGYLTFIADFFPE